MPSVESGLVRALLLGQKLRQTHRLPIGQQRLEMELGSRASLMPPGARAAPADAGGVPAELVGPAAGPPPPRALLYLHGGGYAMGSPRTHRALAARLAAAAGARALVPDYRLAPEHPFPAALEDALAAYRWLLRSGQDPRSLAVAGDSAGGGLALALVASLRAAGDPPPAAALLLSPWTDLAGEGESVRTRAAADPWLSAGSLAVARHYLAGRDPRDPLASPLYGDLSGLPPTLVQVGSDEVLLSDSTRLAERARAAGSPLELEVWEHMWHVWHLFAPTVPEAGRAIARAGSFLSEHLGDWRG